MAGNTEAAYTCLLCVVHMCALHQIKDFKFQLMVALFP